MGPTVLLTHTKKNLKMAKAHVDTGIRKILEFPAVYNLFQEIIGANQHRKKHFQKYFNDTKPEKILDIGCGTGVLLDSLNYGVQYFGIDMQEEYIDYAKQKFSDKKSEFYVSKIGEQELNPDWESSFDAINAHGLLHHLEDEMIHELFNTAKYYLKEGGYLITLDSAYHNDQSFMSKYLVSKDRGQNVKTDKEYLEIASQYFSQIESHIDAKYARIPFSVFVMKLTKS